MNVAGKFYVDMRSELAKAPENKPEITISDAGVVLVKVFEGNTPLWVPAGELKGETEAWEYLTKLLTFRISWAASKAGITKAQMKRDLIRAGVISK